MNHCPRCGFEHSSPKCPLCFPDEQEHELTEEEPMPKKRGRLPKGYRLGMELEKHYIKIFLIPIFLIIVVWLGFKYLLNDDNVKSLRSTMKTVVKEVKQGVGDVKDYGRETINDLSHSVKEMNRQGGENAGPAEVVTETDATVQVSDSNTAVSEVQTDRNATD